MKEQTIGVIGAKSMVGSRTDEKLKEDFRLVEADLNSDISVDITNVASVNNFFRNYEFDTAILFSAFTDVDAAEKQRGDKNAACWQINVEGTKNVVDASEKYRRRLFFISTDFVYPGTSGPYSEDDPIGSDETKLSWYGITKIEAEKIVSKLSDYVILRISYPYRAKFEGKDDIAKRILRLYKENRLYPMFVDQNITPTFIDDIAPAIELLIDSGAKGNFHLASPEITTQYDFAKELLTVFGQDPAKLERASVVEFVKKPGATPRPTKGGLKVGKITSLGFTPTDWRDGIRKIYDQSNGQLL